MNYTSNIRINKLEKRIKALEETASRKMKRLRAKDAQRFLILYHLGIINEIKQLSILQNKKDFVVSVLLDIDLDNSKKFLSESSKKDRPLLNTIANYTFLSDFFEKSELVKITLEVDKILNTLKSDKDLTK